MNNEPLTEDINYRIITEKRRMSENIDQIRKDAHQILLKEFVNQCLYISQI